LVEHQLPKLRVAGSIPVVRSSLFKPKLASLPSRQEERMAAPERRYGGLTLGGILVLVGIIVVVIWSFWIGLIIALIGLVAFGGFVRGKWY
jgi:hypothetical protein